MFHTDICICPKIWRLFFNNEQCVSLRGLGWLERKISKGANYVWGRTQTYVKAVTTFSYRGRHHILIDHLSYARQVLKDLKDNKAEVFPLPCRRVVYSKERWQMLNRQKLSEGIQLTQIYVLEKFCLRCRLPRTHFPPTYRNCTRNRML